MSSPFPIPPPMIKSAWSIQSPSSGDRIYMWTTFIDVLAVKIYSVVRGSSTPSVVWELRFSPDFSSTGTLIASGTTTSTTAGNIVNVMSEAMIPAGSHVWLELDTASGTVLEFGFTLHHRGA